MSAALTGTGLHLRLGRNQVLRGVDIHVDAGKTTTVIGPSGSGKST
ncbi:peptide ABC transporter ATP-binding protein, partial [Nocardia sp. NPDC003345]